MDLKAELAELQQTSTTTAANKYLLSIEVTGTKESCLDILDLILSIDK